MARHNFPSSFHTIANIVSSIPLMYKLLCVFCTRHWSIKLNYCILSVVKLQNCCNYTNYYFLDGITQNHSDSPLSVSLLFSKGEVQHNLLNSACNVCLFGHRRLYLQHYITMKSSLYMFRVLHKKFYHFNS